MKERKKERKKESKGDRAGALNIQDAFGQSFLQISSVESLSKYLKKMVETETRNLKRKSHPTLNAFEVVCSQKTAKSFLGFCLLTKLG